MSQDELLQRIQALEHDNARLRSLLDQRGSTAGLRHQTRNTLAMLRDVVRRSAETSDTVEDYAAHLEGRLDAVFRIQNTIANRLLDGVGLYTLLDDELMVHALGHRERLSIDGPDILLQPAAASALALAFHELATNAIKFGSLSQPEGRLAVNWSIAPGGDGQPLLTLNWIESGVGLTAPRDRAGFGSEVIERVVPYQLSGKGVLDFTPEGLHCTIILPMTPWLGRVQPTHGSDPFSDEPARS
jgi:two-component sensor histidine kinase